MKIAVLIIAILHGPIHLLGFVKAFDFAPVKELTLPVSKPMGLLWLLCTLLFLAYGTALYLNYKYSWIIGLIAVFISQLLIIWFWKDAKFGTVANVLILIVVLISFGSWNFKKMVATETNQILSKISVNQLDIITEQGVANLPVPVQKWIKTTGIMGKPAIKSGRIKQKANMKMKPGQKDWFPAKAIQYTTIEEPAFIWKVSLDMMPFVKIKGRDKYFNGRGEMLIKMNSLIKIVNEKGEKLDEGTIQRYLGEMVWFPSLALSPFIHWEAIDELSARATMNYKGREGSGIFYFNKTGDFIKYSALRYKGNEPGSKRYPWILTVDDYTEFEGIRVPSKMKATWKLDEGDWTWLELEILDIHFEI